MLLGNDELVLLGGFSLKKSLRKVAKVASVPARMTKNVVVDSSKAVAKGTVAAAKGTAKVTVAAGKAVGHAAMELKRASERMAKKIVRGVVLKNLRGEDIESYMLLGSSGDTAAKAALNATVIPLATTAVLASAVAAPAAPLIPVITPPIINEVYDTVKTKMSKGKTMQQAVAEAEAEGPPAFYDTMAGRVTIGVTVALAGYVVVRRLRSRRKS